jgi:hypothetical protein
MRRLEPLMRGMMIILLVLGMCTWTTLASAQTCRDGVSTASGEPTDPERNNHVTQSTFLESSVGSTVQAAPGTRAPVLSTSSTPQKFEASFSQKLEAFFTLLRRHGIWIPRGHR